MFVILSGSSGVGKNTIIKKLEENNPKYKLMPTFTTREKRENEIDGYPFFFISTEEFENKIKNNEFIEYEPMHNKYVGSTYQVYNDYLKNGKVLIKDLGVDGAQNFAKKLGEQTDIIKIFVTTKTKGELKKRLKIRKEKQIKLRLKRYAYEQKQKNKFDWIILNENLEQTCKVLEQILEFKNKDFLPTKKVKKININKITHYFEKLKKGKILEPVKIVVFGGKPYITDGVERFIAGLLAKKPVAKQVVEDRKIKLLNNQEYKDFYQLIKKEI